MKFLHTMVRVRDLDKSLDFYIDKRCLIETRRTEVAACKFTLVYLSTEICGP